MRIHTDLSIADVRLIERDVPGVTATLTMYGSRSHAGAVEVKLSGSGYARNTGTHGASDDMGATWDEWGIWLAALYQLDPTARCGGTAARPIYANADDFHVATGHRFRTLTDPANQHWRHRWEYQGDGSSECQCGATRWPVNTPDPHASLAR